MKKTITSTTMSLVMAGCWMTDPAALPAMSFYDSGGTRSRTARNRSATYADGVYTAAGKYGSLPSSITVTVTLADNLITAVKVIPHATDPTSLDLQRRFAAAVPAVVVGKPIEQLKVGRLAGSSGTPKGFNTAIERIKEQARRTPQQKGSQ